MKRKRRSILQPPIPDLSAPETVVRAVPELARYAAVTWWHAAEWGIGTYFHAASRMVRAAANGESPSEVLQLTGAELRDYGRQLLGIADIEARIWGIVAPEATRIGEAHPDGDQGASAAALLARGSELMRRSADVDYVEDTHPAYARILSELAPDEARILRFLAQEGPQPAVDVRTSRPLNVGTVMVGSGLSMIGLQAGARRLERVPAYLNNLYRLGLVWFSREPVADALRYQVLEVQPDVVAAKRAAGRGRTVRRSVELTPFGKDFCAICLPLGPIDVSTAAAALPAGKAGKNGGRILDAGGAQATGTADTPEEVDEVDPEGD